MTKRMLTMLLAAVILLSANGCAPAPDTTENNSSTSSAAEELQVLQEENEKLKQELAELKGEEQETEAEKQETEEPKEEVRTESGTASEPASKPAAPAEKPAEKPAAPATNNQAAKPQAEKPAANNTQTAAKPQTPAPQKTNNSTGKGPLAKYTVRVKDKTTPAVNVQGEFYEGELAYVFYSDSGKVLGTVPDSSVGIILRQEGLTQAEDDEQKSWFVENFNIYRGLDGGSYEGGPGSTGGGSSSSNEIDIEEFRDEVFRLTNKEREKAGLEPLVEDSTAMEYAQIRAEELAVSYSHTRPNGKDKSLNGLNFIENIAYGQKTPAEVVQDWMNSPGHRATLLSEYSDYGNRFGVGCYKKNSTIYWTQEFVLWDANA